MDKRRVMGWASYWELWTRAKGELWTRAKGELWLKVYYQISYRGHFEKFQNLNFCIYLCFSYSLDLPGWEQTNQIKFWMMSYLWNKTGLNLFEAKVKFSPTFTWGTTLHTFLVVKPPWWAAMLLSGRLCINPGYQYSNCVWWSYNNCLSWAKQTVHDKTSFLKDHIYY